LATAILSDLHLGAAHGDDLLRYPYFCERLREQLIGIEHIVLLGDILDLRFQQLETALQIAGPFFAMLGEVLSTAHTPRVTYIPGNHDHHFAVQLIEAAREQALLDETPFALQQIIAPPSFFLCRQLTRMLGGQVPVRVAYFYDTLDSSQGTILLTHGHYLDLHIDSGPARLLNLAQSVLGAANQGTEQITPDLYEGLLRPQYELLYWIGQSPSGAALQSRIYERLRGGAPADGMLGQLRQTALRRAASAAGNMGLALAETIANRLFKERVSLTSPAREAQVEATIRAFSLSLEALAGYLPRGVHAVVFGHTHRPGPLEGIDASERWMVTLAGQPTMVLNAGSWLYDGGKARRPDYRPQRWPGTYILIPDQGPLRMVEVLADMTRELMEAELSERTPGDAEVDEAAASEALPDAPNGAERPAEERPAEERPVNDGLSGA
jgi:UDP-2,3-diacylglucosamine pyrophosphatase LpxH